MKYWGIQKRILLITLIPCLMVALAMSIYFTLIRNAEQEQQAIEYAQIQARLFASREADIFSFPPNQYRDRLYHYLNLPTVKAIALLDASQNILFNLGPKMAIPLPESPLIQQDLHQIYTDDSVRIKSPIYASVSNDTKLTTESNLLGWIEVEFDLSSVELAQYHAIANALAMVLISLAIGFYLAMKSSRKITVPLQEVANTLEQLETGDLEARAKVDLTDDFSLLGAGINSMASSLQRAQQELQDSVEQSTQDLKETLEEMEVQNIELNMARREALEASQTKSEFLANMSHEIRTPLNGVLGFTKLLAKTSLTKRQKEYLQTIESSSSSLLSIINDILDFSKIEAGKLVLDKTPLDIRDLVDEVLTMLAPESHKKNLELTVLVYKDVPFELIGDPLRLKQILTNLVNNAIKFTEQGSVIVRVMLEECINNKVVLKMSVTDTGIGLSEVQKNNLFKAFSQADTSTTRRFGGTGLGLIISKYLVEQMQGDIGIDSAPGVGSCFWFTADFQVSSFIDDSWVDTLWTGQHVYIFSQLQNTGQALLNQLLALGFKAKVFNKLGDLTSEIETQVPAICFIELNDARTSQRLWRSLETYCQVVVLLPADEPVLIEYLHRMKLNSHLVYPIANRQLIQVTQDIMGKPQPEDSNQSLIQTESVKVLAVDDNTPNLELLTTWLLEFDVDVVRATGGVQAVTLAKIQHFHLIFMDIQMPDLDGLSAGKQIRKNSLNKDTPLIALTAHALPNERKQLLQQGFDDYLTKPISEQQLNHALMKWTHYQPAKQVINLEEVPNNLQPENRSFQLKNNKINLDSSAVDITQCLEIAGGKTELATNMFEGLLDEMKNIKPIIRDNSASELIEAVHKLHGLSRYIGAPRLRIALEEGETCLKTNQNQWLVHKPAILSAIEEVEQWALTNNWQEQFNNEANQR